MVTPSSEQAGPQAQLPSDPLGLFSLFFDDTLVDLIVEETNRYAEQTLQGTDKEWSTDAAEIRAYMGFMILMGINHLSEIRDYWSTNEYLHYAPIADRISRDRFEQITRYLHFTDNDSLPSRGEEGYSTSQTTRSRREERKVTPGCRRWMQSSTTSRTGSSPYTTRTVRSVLTRR